MSKTTKQKAIEIYELVANEWYACEISSPSGDNCETQTGNGSDMVTAIENGEYSEYNLSDANKDDAVKAYTDMVERGEINGEGFDTYDYHRLTVTNNSLMEIAFIPVGGW